MRRQARRQVPLGAVWAPVQSEVDAVTAGFFWSCSGKVEQTSSEIAGFKKNATLSVFRVSGTSFAVFRFLLHCIVPIATRQEACRMRWFRAFLALAPLGADFPYFADPSEWHAFILLLSFSLSNVV